MHNRAFSSFSLVFLTICIGCLPIEGTVTPPSSCGALPSIPGGHFSDGDTSIGAERKLTCDAGYKLTGSDVLRCLEGGRWLFRGNCVKVDCGEKPKFKCSEGFGIEFYSANCSDDGFWITILKCAPDCGPLPEIAGATFSEGTNWIGSTREVSCEYGNILEGNSTITCEANGLWSKAPTCTKDSSYRGDEIASGGDYGENDGVSGSADVFDFKTDENSGNAPSGNISCSESDKTELYWPNQRCDGSWDCLNGTDEVNCPEKCRGLRYLNVSEPLFDCRAAIPRVYYDWESGECIDFIYGGCAEIVNMFRSQEECRRECDGVIITLPTTTTAIVDSTTTEAATTTTTTWTAASTISTTTIATTSEAVATVTVHEPTTEKWTELHSSTASFSETPSASTTEATQPTTIKIDVVN